MERVCGTREGEVTWEGVQGGRLTITFDIIISQDSPTNELSTIDHHLPWGTERSKQPHLVQSFMEVKTKQQKKLFSIK